MSKVTRQAKQFPEECPRFIVALGEREHVDEPPARLDGRRLVLDHLAESTFGRGQVLMLDRVFADQRLGDRPGRIGLLDPLKGSDGGGVPAFEREHAPEPEPGRAILGMKPQPGREPRFGRGPVAHGDRCLDRRPLLLG